MTAHDRAREDMVRRQLRARGIHDDRVLQAMALVPREKFVAPGWESDAYSDQPLPIGGGQTISQPYVVARMAELAEIRRGDRVLNVGVGSGYQTAVLAVLAGRVAGVEIRRELAAEAETRLAALGLEAAIRIGDGGYGWPERAPFDAILVAAAARRVPAPLLAQLAEGGRLVLPEGDSWRQELVRYRRRDEDFTREEMGPVRFVAFMGDYGERLAPDTN